MRAGWKARQSLVAANLHMCIRSAKIKNPATFFVAVFFIIDLGQSTVFHNFARQIALFQYSGRSKHMPPVHNQ